MIQLLCTIGPVARSEQFGIRCCQALEECSVNVLQDGSPLQQDAVDKQPGVDHPASHPGQSTNERLYEGSRDTGDEAIGADRFVVMRDAELLQTSSSIAVWQQQLELVRITMAEQGS